MRNFVKLSPNYWVGATGRALRDAGPEAQLVALYLLSSPHTNYIGLYRLPLAYAAADLGIAPEQLRELLATVAATGFAGYDTESETAWVYEAAAFQIGDLADKDKRTVAAQSEFETLPSDCPYLADFYEKYRAALHLKPRKGQQAARRASLPVTQKAWRTEHLRPAPTEAAAAPKGDAPGRALDRLMQAREAAGLSEPEDDRELSRLMCTVAYEDGQSAALRVLQAALAAQDYTLHNLQKYRADARETMAHETDDI